MRARGASAGPMRALTMSWLLFVVVLGMIAIAMHQIATQMPAQTPAQMPAQMSAQTPAHTPAQMSAQTHRAAVEADLGSPLGRMVGMPTTRPAPTTRSTMGAMPTRGVPINIRTSGDPEAPYEQVGFLSGAGGQGSGAMLPLHGRPIHSARNRWQYYTMSDKFHAIRLPIMVGGRNASSEYGCDEVNTGDHVYVEGYDVPFRVTLYEKDHHRYIPYL